MRPFNLVLIVCVLASCRSPDLTARVERLESDNRELKKKLEDSPKDYSDAQIKCLTASKLYLKELLAGVQHGASITKFTNHYNKKLGGCFAFSESRKRTGTGKKRTTETYRELYNVYDQVYVAMIQTQFQVNELSDRFETTVSLCDVDNRPCDSEEEFMKNIHPYITE